MSRLYFSIETSARLLYHAIRASKKEPSSITVMDYGAGVGTLYTLAKLIGCKKVIYNDYLESWKTSAQRIAEAIDIQVDLYITGDIEATMHQLRLTQDTCDLIVSRNVIEHIYDLNSFYSTIAQYFPQAIIFSSTTANIKNPGTRWQHKKIHNKIEPVYYGFRKDIIQNIAPDLSEDSLEQLTTATRGLANDDLTKAVTSYLETQQLPNVALQGSNTCDPNNGVWAEHLISFNAYRKAIEAAGYEARFRPGFWDTHYKSSLKNTVTKCMNAIINASPTLGCYIAPFIYVIASPSSHE